MTIKTIEQAIATVRSALLLIKHSKQTDDEYRNAIIAIDAIEAAWRDADGSVLLGCP